MSGTTEFVRCNCGKERPVGIDARLGEHTERRLAAMSACRSCEADVSIAMDICPESMPIPGGTSSCSLTWHHQGRCVPYPSPFPIGDQR